MSTIFSLRPWPTPDRKPKNLAEFIARVQVERGGFRNVTETTLKEELEARESGVSEAKDTEMRDVEDEEAIEKVDPAAVRMEMLRKIDAGLNSSIMSLELISLLLTKETPVQAGMTLSQQLRDMVGIGTLGSTLVESSNITPAKTADDQTIATGWTLLDITKMVVAARKAQKMLEKEVELEESYWADVVSVTENGWSVCRLPQQRHTLGVRYGFSEAFGEYRANSLAPMKRGDNGRVELGLGRFGGGCQRIAVSLERGGEVIYRTVASAPATTADSALEAKVLQARNTIFSQELWHELHREAHSLTSYGVRTEGSALVYTSQDGDKLHFDLISLEAGETSADDHVGSSFTEIIHLCLHVLLSHSHRQNEMNRLRPTPPNNRGRNFHQAELLRPIFARLVHQQAVEACVRYVGDLTRIVRQAGIPDASFVLSTVPCPTQDLTNNQLDGHRRASPAQLLVNALLASLEFRLDVTLTPQSSLSIRARTYRTPQTTTRYQIALMPSADKSSENPLYDACPPFEGGYPTFSGLVYYLEVATTRALARHVLRSVETNTPPRDPDTDVHDLDAHRTWIVSAKGNGVRDMQSERHAITFKVLGKDGHPSLEAQASWVADRKLRNTALEWCHDRSGIGDKEGKQIGTLVAEICQRQAG